VAHSIALYSKVEHKIKRCNALVSKTASYITITLHLNGTYGLMK